MTREFPFRRYSIDPSEIIDTVPLQKALLEKILEIISQHKIELSQKLGDIVGEKIEVLEPNDFCYRIIEDRGDEQALGIYISAPNHPPIDDGFPFLNADVYCGTWDKLSGDLGAYENPLLHLSAVTNSSAEFVVYYKQTLEKIAGTYAAYKIICDPKIASVAFSICVSLTNLGAEPPVESTPPEIEELKKEVSRLGVDSISDVFLVIETILIQCGLATSLNRIFQRAGYRPYAHYRDLLTKIPSESEYFELAQRIFRLAQAREEITPLVDAMEWKKLFLLLDKEQNSDKIYMILSVILEEIEDENQEALVIAQSYTEIIRTFLQSKDEHVLEVSRHLLNTCDEQE